MGSSGSGRFTDYPGTKPREVTGSGSGVGGGTSGVDRCKIAFNVLLEDVGNSQYFSQYNTVPPVGQVLSIAFNGKRIFAVTNTGIQIGALPTTFNYLAACLETGVSYVRLVSTSASSPVPTVSADFKAV